MSSAITGEGITIEAGESRPRTLEQRRLEQVERLLVGERADLAQLAYDLDVWHLAVVACGSGAADVLRDLGPRLDRRPLVLSTHEGTVWAWFGGRSEPDLDVLRSRFASGLPSGVSLALGEAGTGLSGFRRSHRQAAAALAVAQRSSQPCVRYRDFPLEASLLQDNLLASSLSALYLAPLESHRDKGKAARATLRAYFAAHRNASSAAKSLNVDRRTVTYRLRRIEDSIGTPLAPVATEVELALRLHDLSDPATT